MTESELNPAPATEAALRHLRQADPVLAALIDRGRFIKPSPTKICTWLCCAPL
ncbi:hypothetical protein [Hymenobacter cellulosilyticus]|uniref:Uncharacterized protein n=1 Tax=Hymenobacter cellulosilyticus TaxID=2932248 RepID=A0A8T9Q433_9BACT|nr:hypothetical protein [Hymenobacter cellulosilyticus]UOQ71722.1 hypothetical protein MUN79_24475 [Hymenobacter cellulosilyticus]